MKRFIPWVALALVLTGCAGKVYDPVTISADTAALVGEQATSTNNQYVQLCAAKALTVATCDRWRKFYLDFRPKYHTAHAAFKLATAKGEIQNAQDAAARIQALSTQLLLYALTSGQGGK